MSFKGTLFCSNELNQISLLHAHSQWMSELCTKFYIPALNTVGRAAET